MSAPLARPPWTPPTHRHRLLAATALVLTNAWDAMLTQLLVSRGLFTELNAVPKMLLELGPWQLVAVKVAVIGLVAWRLHVASSRHRRAWWTLLALTGVFSAICAFYVGTILYLTATVGFPISF